MSTHVFQPMKRGTGQKIAPSYMRTLVAFRDFAADEKNQGMAPSQDDLMKATRKSKRTVRDGLDFLVKNKFLEEISITRYRKWRLTRSGFALLRRHDRDQDRSATAA